MVQNGSQKLIQLKRLIALASCGATGKTLNTEVDDWDIIFGLAIMHNVMPLVASALISTSDSGCPSQIRESFLEAMRTTCSMNLIRKQRIFSLLSEMSEAGITVRVIKGYAVAANYIYPECRNAVDTDILVTKEQEKQVYEFFKKKEFHIIRRSRTSHHGICQHKRFGKVEVHTKLYDEIVEDIWFRGLSDRDCFREKCEEIRTSEGTIMTLGPTDQLLFLTLHMVKHFIDGGLSIGMMLDVALHYERNWELIDSKRYWSVLKKLQYEVLVNAVLTIMVRYAGFDRSTFIGMHECSDEQMDMILSDLSEGGYIGVSERNDRYDSGMEYNRLLLTRNMGTFQYTMYMLRWKVRSASEQMFTTCPELMQIYPWLERMKILIPFAWVYRVFSYPLEKLHTGIMQREIRSKDQVINDRVAARIKLFETLGML